MDTLIIEVPHFPMPTGYRIDHSEPRRKSTGTYRQFELFVPLSPQFPSLAFAPREVLAIRKPQPSRIAVWFLAVGVHTAKTVM